MKKQGFLKGSAVLMTMVLVTKLLGLAYKIPLTSMLGGSGMSCYSGAFAVFTPVFALAAGGVTGAVSSIVSSQLALGRYKNAVRIHRTAYLLFFTLAAALAGLLTAGSGVLADDVIHDGKARLTVIAVALSLPLQAIVNVRRGWAEGLGSMTPTASSEIAETAAKLVFGLAAPFAVMRYASVSFVKYHGCFGRYCTDLREAGMYALPYASAASAAGIAAASLVCCLFLFCKTAKMSRECAAEFSDYSLSLDISRGRSAALLLSRSLPASLIMLVATLSGVADLMTIAPALDRAMAADPTLFAYLAENGIAQPERSSFVYGSYTALAMMVFGLLPTFTAMLGKSVLPELSSAVARGRKRETESILGSMYLMSAGIALPGGVGVCILAKPLLGLMFHGSAAEISVSAAPLSILGAGVVFMGVSLPCLTAMQACGRQMSAMLVSLVGIAVKLALNLLLIPMPELNICGAAVATVVSQAVVCFGSVKLLTDGCKAPRRVMRRLYDPAIPALLCGAAAYLVQRLVDERLSGVMHSLGVLASVTFGAIICLISFALLCISPKYQFFRFFTKKNVKSP